MTSGSSSSSSGSVANSYGINKAFMVCVMDCEYYSAKNQRFMDYTIP